MGHLLLLFLLFAEGLHLTGVPGAACVNSVGVAAVVDACGVCGGNGTSCTCTGGFLDFTMADANAAVLCHVNEALLTQIESAAVALKMLETQLETASCELSAQLNFGAWLNTLNNFCSGSACPATVEENLSTFFQANNVFDQAMLRQLSQR